MQGLSNSLKGSKKIPKYAKKITATTTSSLGHVLSVALPLVVIVTKALLNSEQTKKNTHGWLILDEIYLKK